MKRIVSLLLTLAALPVMAQQNRVTIEPDTIVAGDGEAKVRVFMTRPTLDLNCAARKGGGTFSEFKTVQTSNGSASEVTFSSPFPGEVDIDVLDNKFNKVGFANVTVVAPEVTILEEKSLDQFNAAAKSMPLFVSVTDHRGRFLKTAKLVCKIHEIVNKKAVATTTKVSEFVLRDGYYEAYISGLKDASYKIEVIDEGHLEAFDRSDNRDFAHPSSVIEGLNISL